MWKGGGVKYNARACQQYDNEKETALFTVDPIAIHVALRFMVNEI